MELSIATTNKHKVEEISKILSEYGIALGQKNVAMIEPDSGTLEEIAKSKAEQAFAKLKKPVIAEDTGVYFDAYNYFPGVLAKRVYEGIGFDGLLALIKKVPDWRAHFEPAICYFDGKRSRVFSGRLNGSLLIKTVSVGKDRLPYEKLFVPDGYKTALVDLPLEGKNKISHRAQAARKLGEWLSQRMKK